MICLIFIEFWMCWQLLNIEFNENPSAFLEKHDSRKHVAKLINITFTIFVSIAPQITFVFQIFQPGKMSKSKLHYVFFIHNEMDSVNLIDKAKLTWRL